MAVAQKIKKYTFKTIKRDGRPVEITDDPSAKSPEGENFSIEFICLTSKFDAMNVLEQIGGQLS